jgi:hypothetical protein
LKWSRTPDCVLSLNAENWIMVDDNVGRIDGKCDLGKLSRTTRKVLQQKWTCGSCLNDSWSYGSRMVTGFMIKSDRLRLRVYKMYRKIERVKGITWVLSISFNV